MNDKSITNGSGPPEGASHAWGNGPGISDWQTPPREHWWLFQ
jgi:hypothetical protein